LPYPIDYKAFDPNLTVMGLNRHPLQTSNLFSEISKNHPLASLVAIKRSNPEIFVNWIASDTVLAMTDATFETASIIGIKNSATSVSSLSWS
jgi:hypothetical protein